MKYKTVVIDPPWSIQSKPHSQEVLKKNTLGHLSYDTLTLQEIRDFPINDFAADNCQLFIWGTTGKVDNKPILAFIFELLELWGFRYHQMITWGKTSGFCIFSPIRSMTEHAIYAYRGKIAEGYNHMNNLFVTSQEPHSQKPAKFYQMLRSWTPTPRIDLFARRAHEGFDGWGDEYVGEGPLQEYLQ